MESTHESMKGTVKKMVIDAFGVSSEAFAEHISGCVTPKDGEDCVRKYIMLNRNGQATTVETIRGFTEYWKLSTIRPTMSDYSWYAGKKASSLRTDPICTLCNQAINVGARRKFLTCAHVFHLDRPDCLGDKAITDWLRENETCPICRTHQS